MSPATKLLRLFGLTALGTLPFAATNLSAASTHGKLHLHPLRSAASLTHHQLGRAESGRVESAPRWSPSRPGGSSAATASGSSNTKSASSSTGNGGNVAANGKTQTNAQGPGSTGSASTPNAANHWRQNNVYGPLRTVGYGLSGLGWLGAGWGLPNLGLPGPGGAYPVIPEPYPVLPLPVLPVDPKLPATGTPPAGPASTPPALPPPGAKTAQEGTGPETPVYAPVVARDPDPSGAAASAKLKANDVILSLGGLRTEKPDDLYQAAKKFAGQKVEALILDGTTGEERTIAITPAADGSLGAEFQQVRVK